VQKTQRKELPLEMGIFPDYANENQKFFTESKYNYKRKVVFPRSPVAVIDVPSVASPAWSCDE